MIFNVTEHCIGKLILVWHPIDKLASDEVMRSQISFSVLEQFFVSTDYQRII